MNATWPHLYHNTNRGPNDPEFFIDGKPVGWREYLDERARVRRMELLDISTQGTGPSVPCSADEQPQQGHSAAEPQTR